MSYISLYRKWRPRLFEEVIGQQHVTTTLKNAIISNRVSHAYLLAGPRGTGKTTIAKILANALNCVTGPTPTPCNECDICTSTINGSNPDVLEIDAASNRGIDEIRDLKEKVHFSTTKGLYKVYIVDEVHMLTTEAFNALLKLLEEPPAHTIFVLATTEPHKVPATVLSRCQRFDLRRIDAADIERRLVHVAEVEGMVVEPSVFPVIARHVKGSLRDALGLLEQLAAYTANDVKYQDILYVLEVTDADVLFKMTELVSKRDFTQAMLAIEGYTKAGMDILQFARDWQAHFRNLFVAQHAERDTAELLAATTTGTFEELRTQSGEFATYELTRYIEILGDAVRDTRGGAQPRLALEIAILQMTRDEVDLSLDGILFRLKKLEERIERSTVGGSSEERSSLSGATPQIGQRTAAPTPAGHPNLAAKEPTKSASRSESGATESPAPVINAAADGTPSTGSKPVSVPDSAHEVAPAVASDAAAREISIERLQRMWPLVLERIKDKRIGVYSLLLGSKPLSLDGNTLNILVGIKFSKDQLELPSYRDFIANVCEDVIGLKLFITCEVATSGKSRTERAPTEDPMSKRSAEPSPVPAAPTAAPAAAPAAAPITAPITAVAEKTGENSATQPPQAPQPQQTEQPQQTQQIDQPIRSKQPERSAAPAAAQTSTPNTPNTPNTQNEPAQDKVLTKAELISLFQEGLNAEVIEETELKTAQEGKTRKKQNNEPF